MGERLGKGGIVVTKGSDLLVAALENEGVEYIFGVPGEENLDVVELLRRSSIELVLTRHEQSAAFMAATHGRLTGRPGVCIATLGPGALNLVTGAAYAHLGAMPMILITGQKGIMSSRQARFQIVDMVATMRPLTKSTRQIVSTATIPTLVRDAFRVAMEERPGPVHLELPEDIAGEDAPDLPMVPPHPIELPVAPPAALDRAAAMILAAKRPLVMLGAAASRPRLTAGLTEFVPPHPDPVLQHADGQGHGRRRPQALPGHRGALGARLRARGDRPRRPDRRDRPRHDREAAVPDGPGRAAGDPRQLHAGQCRAGLFPACRGGGRRRPEPGAAGRPARGQARRRPRRWPSLREEILGRIADRADEDRFPPTPQRIVHDVRQVMPEDGIVALDNGMYKIWFARNYRTWMPNTLLLDNALATMGAGLPSAMMAAMLHPERRVLAVCGDGGFMMNSQELETAVRLKLNLVVLILDDNGYGMIRWKQAVDHFPDWGLTFGNPDFVKYAEAYGAKGSRVEATEDLVPTLEAAFAGGGVHLVTVPIDYSENMRVLVDELKNRVPAAASA